MARVEVSLMKVEKVVKPPQKPGVSSRRVAGEAGEAMEGMAVNRPMRKQPATFTTEVPTGKAPGCHSSMSLETA